MVLQEMADIAAKNCWACSTAERSSGRSSPCPLILTTSSASSPDLTIRTPGRLAELGGVADHQRAHRRGPGVRAARPRDEIFEVGRARVLIFDLGRRHLRRQCVAVGRWGVRRASSPAATRTWAAKDLDARARRPRHRGPRIARRRHHGILCRAGPTSRRPFRVSRFRASSRDGVTRLVGARPRPLRRGRQIVSGSRGTT